MNKVELSENESPDACKAILISAMRTSFATDRPDMIAAASALAAFESKGRSRRVAIVEGEAIGFVDWSGSEIAWLMVRSDFQGRGVGSFLVGAVEQLTRHDLRTLCVSTNKRALNFYIREGFHIISQNVPGRMFGVAFENYLLEKKWSD